jgi:hypothetical protein
LGWKGVGSLRRSSEVERLQSLGLPNPMGLNRRLQGAIKEALVVSRVGQNERAQILFKI